MNVTNSTAWWSDCTSPTTPITVCTNRLHKQWQLGQLLKPLCYFKRIYVTFASELLWIFTSQEAQEVARAGRCDCIPACVDYMSLCVCLCIHALWNKCFVSDLQKVFKATSDLQKRPN